MADQPAADPGPDPDAFDRSLAAADLDAPGMGPPMAADATPGLGGRIKVRPEDFVVEEIPLLPPAARGQGKYTVAMVRSKGWETHKLARRIAGRLGVHPEAVHFAGTKDKRAVATRMIAVKAPEARVRALDLGDVEVLETFRADRAPKLGELSGNRFEVVVRDLDVGPGGADEARARLAARAKVVEAAGGVPNHFGPQRFGTVRPITHRVGEAVVRGDLEAAVMHYVGHPFPGETGRIRTARARLEEERDFEAARAWYPERLSYERAMVEHLADAPGDFAGALSTLPGRLQRLCVYAYQSALFNRLLARRVEAGLPLSQAVEGDLVCDVGDDGFADVDRLFHVHADNLEAVEDRCRRGLAWTTGPLFGTRTPLAEGEPGDLERAVLEEEDLTPPDFVVPEIPRLTTRGTRRPLLAPVEDLAWSVEEADEEEAVEGESVEAEENAEAEGARAGDAGRTGGPVAHLSFTLPKGTYATSVLRELLR